MNIQINSAYNNGANCLSKVDSASKKQAQVGSKSLSTSASSELNAISEDAKELSNAIVAAKQQPELRADKIAIGKELLMRDNYPDDKTLAKIAESLTKNIFED